MGQPPNSAAISSSTPAPLSGAGRRTAVASSRRGLELRGLVRLAGARGDDDQHGGVGHATCDEVEPAQRLGVRPLRVVDHDLHGLGVTEVREQPVEAMDRGERVDFAIRPGRTIAARTRSARGRRCPPAGATARPASARSIGGSRSWRATPNGISRSSCPARASSTRAVRGRPSSVAAARSVVFPIPAGPSISTIDPWPSTSRLQSICHDAQLVLALEQARVGPGIRHRFHHEVGSLPLLWPRAGGTLPTLAVNRDVCHEEAVK